MKFDKESKFQNIYIPLLLFLIAFVWKLFYAGQRDLCLDEPYSVFNAQKSLGEIWKISASGEPTPPLFMLLLHFWMKIVGLEPAALRILPLLFNAATVIFLYLIGKRFFSIWAGLVAAGLFIFSTFHFYHGIEARAYSLFVLAASSALYYFLLFTEDTKNHKALTGLIISNVLMIYTHHFSWFVILSEFLTCFFYVRSFRSFLKLMIPILATVIGFAPMIPIIFKQFKKSTRIGTWLNPPRKEDFLNQIQAFLNHKEVYMLLLYVFAAGLIFTIVMIVLKKWKGFNINVAVPLVWWIVPYTLMFYISYKVPMFNSKYVLFTTIGLFIFIAALINLLFNKHKYIEPAVGLLVVVFMFMHLKILPSSFAYREVKNSVEFAKQYDTEKAIILIYPVWSDFAFNFYYDRSIFCDFGNYYETMKLNHLYRVWGIDNARSVIKAHPNRRVIYYQDGKNYNKGEDIFAFLDSTYSQVSVKSFPQTFTVGVYDPKNTSSKPR